MRPANKYKVTDKSERIDDEGYTKTGRIRNPQRVRNDHTTRCKTHGLKNTAANSIAPLVGESSRRLGFWIRQSGNLQPLPATLRSETVLSAGTFDNAAHALPYFQGNQLSSSQIVTHNPELLPALLFPLTVPAPSLCTSCTLNSTSWLKFCVCERTRQD